MSAAARAGRLTRATDSMRLSGTEAAPVWRGRLHLGALVLAVPAVVVLAWREPDPVVLAYGAALVALFGVSAAYHLLPVSPERRALLRRADHVTIYVYIALAYLPVCRVVTSGTLAWVVPALVSAGAAAGVAAKVFGFERSRVVSGLLYLVLGWLALLMLPDLVRHLDGLQFGLLLATGGLYTGGAAVLAAGRPDPRPEVFGYHEIWHACVVLACACYYVVIWTLPALRLG